MRIIPGKTKVRVELFKDVSLADFLVGLAFAGFMLLAVTSSAKGRLYYACGILFVGVMLLVKIGDEPNYMFFLSMIRHMSFHKSYRKSKGGKSDIRNISSFTGIEDGLILYGDYYGAAIEIPPVEFRFFSSYRRTVSIDDCFANVLRSLNGNYAANLVKIERKVDYDGYIENENDKLDELRKCFEYAMISEEEYQAKCEVIFDRLHELDALNDEDQIVAPYYYLVLFDSDKNQLRHQVESALNNLQRGEMQPRRLNSKELAVFLRYTNEIDFDEKEIDELEEAEYARWAMPESLKLRPKHYILNDVTAYTMAINNFPTWVGDAWLAGVMSIPSTKVVVKLRPMDKQKTIRNIDRSISELRARYNQSGVESTRIELGEHIQSLGTLLSMLQSDNEVLLNTDVYVTCYDVSQTRKDGREKAVEYSKRATIANMRAVIRREYRETELRMTNLQFKQMEGYVGSQISGYDPLEKSLGRGIPGSTAAAMYPWIYAHVQDPKGIKLGSEEGIPVFIDMFRRDSERVNSNMVIVGKSGSGKSYAAKTVLVNLAADNSKIFVLDPENEYTELANNLHGKFINVGNAQQGRMNPFQIITALDDDDVEGGVTGSYASHMQFLEEFFRQILPDCDKESLEYLNSLADRVYMNCGITAETNLSLLSAEDYPIFDDLYDEILKEFQATENDYLRAILRTLMNYVSKFSTGGRNANIWNGPSTISTDENFTVFNFQSLLAGGNSTITNAQMMLVMKYIDNEIIKNRDYNKRYGTNRKIVVVIDEAHVFIDEKYPIALDFMFQLAKRIRKYNGMQIVITQNIKDFVGSEEISRKSSAIINACQYSFIFPLAPNDMDDLCKLYEKAGGINESEQEKIVTAPRGNAFVILGPTSRSSFQVVVPKNVAAVFAQSNLPSHYFIGDEGREAWESFVGESRELYRSNLRVKEQIPEERNIQRTSGVTLIELTEEEYEQEQQKLNAKKVSFTENAPHRPAQAAPGTAAFDPGTQAAPAGSEEMTRMFSELHRMVDSVGQISENMGRFSENMGRISYEAMLSDIVSRLGGRMSEQNIPAAQTPSVIRSAPVPEAADEPVPSARPRMDFFDSPAFQEEPATERETDDTGDFLDYLDDLFTEDSEKQTGEKAEEAAPEKRSILDILQEKEDEDAFLEPLESDPRAEESGSESASGADEMKIDDSDDFDIMAFVEQMSKEITEKSPLEEMVEKGEVTRIITLDELIKLNASRKISK